MDAFDDIQWRSGTDDDTDNSRPATSHSDVDIPRTLQDDNAEDMGPQAGPSADAVDLAGVGIDGKLITTVGDPQTVHDGTKDAFVNYLVTTDSNFSFFQRHPGHITVRRRFTDFVFLYKALSREFPQCAVPPLPDKHKMEYVRGDRFGSDFTARRAHSLHRFLKRITQHPILRKTPLLLIFLETPDWNAHMRKRPARGAPANASDQGGVFEGLTDTFLNAFSKVHKPDRRFIEVRERADKLDEDLGHVEKIISRVVRRDADLEADYADLSKEFLKLVGLEPELAGPITVFANAVQATSTGLKTLKEHTDQDYLGSLRDMESYIVALKSLLKTREQKQLDYEALTDYLARAVAERDQIASAPSGTTGLSGPTGFLRSKIEDVRGVDHEQSRRDRVRKLELKIEELTRESESARNVTEMFDEEVVKEVVNFERIKSNEMKDTLGGLAAANVDFYKGMVETWERMLMEVENDVVEHEQHQQQHHRAVSP